MKKENSTFRKSLRIGLFVLVALLLYAYGFKITKVELEAFRSESRQASRERVMRRLASPRIFEYEQDVTIAIQPMIVPCAEFNGTLPEKDVAGPHLKVTPTCAFPGDIVAIEGYNFTPKSSGTVSFIPSTDETSTLALIPSSVVADRDGNFELTYKIPQRESDDYQLIRATLRQNVGSPFFSQTSIDTWDKIIETVFMALMATSVGMVISIPVSFLAAKNLMKDVKSPLSSVSFNLLGWPIGFLLGLQVAKGITIIGNKIGTNPIYEFLGIVICLIIVIRLVQYVFQFGLSESSSKNYLQKITINIGVMIAAFLGIFLFGKFAMHAGVILMDVSSEKLSFIGNLPFQIGDLINESFQVLTALIFAAVVSSQLGKIGQGISENYSSRVIKVINIIGTPLAFVILVTIFGKGLDWLYKINDVLLTFWIPVSIAAVLGILLAIANEPKKPIPTGQSIYLITRTLLNATRSVEPIIMAIVGVIWVGIGPFAGVLALALHTVAALSKLYSEQVESISEGPLEAIRATGANRLQTIIYGVIPQIVPPYISFTMYRWDINVRMSTVIGLVGGGGIGTLLIQNINLLNYRDASVQMLAIAVVVASMDYLSSMLRERIV